MSNESKKDYLEKLEDILGELNNFDGGVDDAIELVAKEAKRSISPPKSKLVDPEEDWHKATLLFANAIKPDGVWWTITYMAPYARVGKSSIAIIGCPKTGRILFGFRDQVSNQANTWWIPGGNFEHGEKSWDTLKRELDEELGGQFVPTSKKPLEVIEFYKDIGGEKNRPTDEFVYLELLDEEVEITHTDDETTAWQWLDEEEILGPNATHKMAHFADEHPDMIHKAYAHLRSLKEKS